ncbi:RNA polymerase sigma factor [Embleya hyalina]|uniref:Transcriptional regulator WhiB n=1 Tax=Embleya hyalina TaxID=516124 RepID=A0A401Z438_9ACTN|nr:RNA polymerase sigma factor [Embleya hyalina]GCE01595.1 transcriptional regulator WhiB [Embleya hyalina]
MTGPQHGGDASGLEQLRAALILPQASIHERDVFVEFLVAEQPFVVRFLMRLGATSSDAEDAAQEAFIRAWQMLNRGLWFKVREPRGWIRHVALRSWQRPNGCRRRDREIPTAEVPEPHARPSDGSELTLATLATRSALASLPGNEGIALALKMDGFTSAESAQILGVTDQQARDLLKKARRRLRRTLASEQPSPEGRTL